MEAFAIAPGMLSQVLSHSDDAAVVSAGASSSSIAHKVISVG